MRKISSAALGAALLLGTGGVMVAAPVLARDAQPRAANFNLSGPVRTAAVQAQAALAATPKDLATAETAVNAAQAAAANDDDRYIVATLRVQLESAKIAATPGGAQSDAALGPPLDVLIASPRTAPADLVRFTYARANIYFNARDFAHALPLYLRARELGMNSQDLTLSIVQSKVSTGDVAGGMADMQTAVQAEETAGRHAPEAWYRFAIARLYQAGQIDQSLVWTRGWLTNYGTRQNWRDAIVSFGFSGPASARLSDRNRLDLYRLLHATSSLTGSRDYVDYADSAIKSGLPIEARTVLDEGRANASVQAANPTANGLYGQARAGIASDRPIATQEASARSAATGTAAEQAGDSYLGSRNFTKAVEMYRLALSKGGVQTDRVNLHLGVALAQTGSRAEAQTALSAVPASSPLVQIAALWSTYAASPPTS